MIVKWLKSKHTVQQSKVTNLGHDHVLAFLHIFPFGLNDGVQKVEVLNVPALCGQAMYKMMQHRLADLRTELEIIAENLLHCFCLEKLGEKSKREENTLKKYEDILVYVHTLV